MAKRSGPELGALGTAAVALEAELVHFENAAHAAMRLPLDSERNIDEAARAVNEAVETQLRIGERIHALMTALDGARDRNQHTAESLTTRGQAIQRRADEYASLLARFNDIGREAAETSESVRLLGTAQPPAKDATVSALSAIEARMRGIVDSAAALVTDAKTAGFGDLADQAHALRQQVQSALNKVTLVHGQLDGTR